MSVLRKLRRIVLNNEFTGNPKIGTYLDRLTTELAKFSIEEKDVINVFVEEKRVEINDMNDKCYIKVTAIFWTSNGPANDVVIEFKPGEN